MSDPQTDSENFEGFDFWRDVIGDDLVVGGVVYNSNEWQLDGEGGVERREPLDGVEEPSVLEYTDGSDAPPEMGDDVPTTNLPEPPSTLDEHGRYLQDPEDPF